MRKIVETSPRRLPLAALMSTMFGIVVADTLGATTIPVTDCTDGSGSGTLRNTIASAPDGATLDLMCSTVTLTNGRIFVPDSITNIYIVGQGPLATTIEGVNDRVFIAANVGVLELNEMTIADGQYAGSVFPQGGCIYAAGSVGMVDTVVTGCSLSPASGTATAKGAGIYAKKFMTLIDCSITGNEANAAPGQASLGAGLYAGDGVTLLYVTLSDNIARAGSGGASSRGGGMFTKGGGNVLISNSTISGNTADINSAMDVYDAYGQTGSTTAIVSSTISGNMSNNFQAAGSYLPVEVTNSTIAFNHVHATGSVSPAGLYSSQQITMNSSLFAENRTLSGAENDVFSRAASDPLVGSNNLILATSNPSVPFGTISSCPHLGHLSNNGGSTLTIPLLANSPALDVGAANGIASDQRGDGFPRTVGSGPDIGAYERQAGVTDDVIFFGEFESSCN